MSDMRRADEAEVLVGKIEALGQSLSRELQQSRVGRREELECKLKKQLKAFAVAFEAYLDVEVRCYEFLRQRYVSQSKAKQPCPVHLTVLALPCHGGMADGDYTDLAT